MLMILLGTIQQLAHGQSNTQRVALGPVGGAVGTSNRVEQGVDCRSVNHKHDRTLTQGPTQLNRARGDSVPPLESGADQTACEGVQRVPCVCQWLPPTVLR